MSSRIGGDEFAILLHETNAASCRHVVERLETKIAEHDRLDGIPLSISLGFATSGAHDVSDQIANVIGEADRMLLERKRQTSLRLSA